MQALYTAVVKSGPPTLRSGDTLKGSESHVPRPEQHGTEGRPQTRSSRCRVMALLQADLKPGACRPVPEPTAVAPVSMQDASFWSPGALDSLQGVSL